MSKGVATSVLEWCTSINAGDRLCTDVDLESLVGDGPVSVDVLRGDTSERHAGGRVLLKSASPDRGRPGSRCVRHTSAGSEASPAPRPPCSSGPVLVPVSRHASLIIRSFSTLSAWARVPGEATMVVPGAAVASSAAFAGAGHGCIRARPCSERPALAEVDARCRSSLIPARDPWPRRVTQIVGEGP